MQLEDVSEGGRDENKIQEELDSKAKCNAVEQHNIKGQTISNLQIPQLEAVEVKSLVILVYI